jgi:hypothetical protein
MRRSEDYIRKPLYQIKDQDEPYSAMLKLPRTDKTGVIRGQSKSREFRLFIFRPALTTHNFCHRGA